MGHSMVSWRALHSLGGFCGVAIVAIALASWPASSDAAMIQLGQVAPPGELSPGGFNNSDLQLSTSPSSPAYVVPPGDGGVITAWSMEGATAGFGMARLRIFRPTGVANHYLTVADSTEEAIATDALDTFATHIAVRPGDVLGFEASEVVYHHPSSSSLDQVGYFAGDPTPGSTNALFETGSGNELLNLAATLETPSAAFSAASGTAGASIAFDGAASTSGDSITDYAWTFGDGTSADSGTSASVSHVYAHPGAYTTTLTITDADGNTAQAAQTVSIAPRPPVAAFVASPTAPVAQAPVSFDGSTSTSPEGSVTGYAWRFGDGSGAGGSRASHSFAAAGTYTVSLTVTDGNGSTASTSQAIVIYPATPQISGASESHRVWRAGTAAATLSRAAVRRAPVGTMFRFTLDEAATVRLVFVHRTRGHGSSSGCAARTRSKPNRRCVRKRPAGELVFLDGHIGPNSVGFQGRLSRRRTLMPGRYEVNVIATNAAGRKSAPTTLSFAIIR